MHTKQKNCQYCNEVGPKYSCKCYDRPAHASSHPSDKAMLNIAISDTLTREGYEEATVDMVFRALNSFDEMLIALKTAKSRYRLMKLPCGNIDRAICRAEAK